MRKRKKRERGKERERSRLLQRRRKVLLAEGGQGWWHWKELPFGSSGKLEEGSVLLGLVAGWPRTSPHLLPSPTCSRSPSSPLSQVLLSLSAQQRPGGCLSDLFCCASPRLCLCRDEMGWRKQSADQPPAQQAASFLCFLFRAWNVHGGLGSRVLPLPSQSLLALRSQEGGF